MPRDFASAELTWDDRDFASAELTWDDKEMVVGEGTFFEIAGCFRRYPLPTLADRLFGQADPTFSRCGKGGPGRDGGWAAPELLANVPRRLLVKD